MSTTERFPRRKYYSELASRTNPVKRDAKIWRYFTFEKFVYLMETSNLYHARMDQLGDPFEGSVTKLHASWRMQADPHGFAERESKTNKRMKALSFVSCWHASEYESAAMWKLYSREDAGVAVISTMERMAKFTVLPPETAHGILAPVEYLDFESFSDTHHAGTQAALGFAKRKSFEHEKEVRGLIRIENLPPDPNLLDSELYIESLKASVPVGVNAEVDLKQLVENICVSPFAGAWFINLVKNAASRAGLGSVVLTSKLVGTPIF